MLSKWWHDKESSTSLALLAGNKVEINFIKNRIKFKCFYSIWRPMKTNQWNQWLNILWSIHPLLINYYRQNLMSNDHALICYWLIIDVAHDCQQLLEGMSCYCFNSRKCTWKWWVHAQNWTRNICIVQWFWSYITCFILCYWVCARSSGEGWVKG